MNIIFVLILGLTAGVFSSWLTRLGSKITESLNMEERYFESIRIFIDVILYLILILLIIIIAFKL